MSRSGVTRQGLENALPGREAVTGAAGAPGPPRRTGRRGETPMVPDADFGSYYGLPIINEPVWRSPDIPAYFYLGGLAGASSALALGAQVTGRGSLAPRVKVAAAAAAGLSLTALVHDLGRPDRFYNMLRVFKPTSPMSVGSWLLAGYAPLAFVAAGSALTDRFPVIGTAATVGAAALGPAVASYTGVLISNTAVPAWHEGHRQMPYLFTSSAATAAGGFGLLAAPKSQNEPARRLGMAGAVGELLLARVMEERMGVAGRAYKTGRARRWMRTSQALTIGGLVGAAAGARRSRLVAAISGTALMAGSAFTRWGVFEAGRLSARDPAHTVVPQKERLRRRGEPGPTAAGPSRG